MRFYIHIGLFLLSVYSLKAQDTLDLLFMGDVMVHQRQIDAAKTDDGYSFDECFSYVKPYISAAGVAVANLEVTLAGEPYTGYPEFSAPDALATALKHAGVDVLLTANNHACDKGRKGVERTLKVLDSLNIKHTGTFYDTIHRRNEYPLCLEQNNIKMALLNYTYGTNEIPTPVPTVVNRIDTQQIAIDIATAQAMNPDIIIATIHWGEEYKLYAGQEQKLIADFLFRQGVRLVIGSHPHVLQEMELHYAEDTTIRQAVVYSLGNFISNMSAVNTETGIMVAIRIVKDRETTRIDKGNYMFTWTYKPEMEEKRRFFVLPAAEYENKPSFFANRQMYERMTKSLSDMRKLYKQVTTGFMEQKCIFEL